MTKLTTPQRNLALFALALGGFAIGISEFATMGVLPGIAQDLLPGYAENPQQVIAQAGTIIASYALGVVVGAPLFAVLGARMSQTRLIYWLLALLALGGLASALMPAFDSLFLARFIAGLPHGAYFGVVSLLAARLMGPGSQGRGIALALSGLTVANVIGVPLSTVLGQEYGWRWVYAVVAFFFALTLVLVLLFVPVYPGDPERSPKRELAALKFPRMWIMMAVMAIGLGGFFAMYSYIAEVTTREAGMGEAMVPWVIATLGVGMVVGNVLGGIFTDRNAARTAIWGLLAMVVAFALYVVLARTPLGLFAIAFVLSALSSMVMPALQARLIRVSNDAKLLGAALNHGAANMANSIGAWLGGLVIAAGLGYLAPGWVGVVLSILGLLLLMVSLAVERRDKARSIDTGGIPLAGL